MDVQFSKLYEDALKLLRSLATPQGILASSIAADNYKRIWARDSIICGIAGLLVEDPIITEGLKNALLNLAEHQHELGMIPSNISPKNKNDVSFGHLVGRIDANTWFMVGACLYYINTKDETSWEKLQPALQKCQSYLKAIEFNAKGWLYTPLSGNWADEYPIHGYTLYDNMLHIWSKTLWQKLQGDNPIELRQIRDKTYANFWPRKATPEHMVYHQPAFDKALSSSTPYFLAYILPGIYHLRFDAAGNALALLNFKLTSVQQQLISTWLNTLKQTLSKKLIPAFWPVIRKTDPEWTLLSGNYSFSFKNHPYHFHNGGIWPVWMGLFCLSLSHNGLQTIAKEIITDFTTTVAADTQWNFNEYLSAPTFQGGGKTQMGFTASGIVFMHQSLQDNKNYLQKLSL